MRYEPSEIIHRTANKHQYTHANRVNDRSEGDPGCDEPGVRFRPQDKYSANYDTQSHH